ncbi:hypothetical protein PENARI_c342G02686 [Penicillium arizonense]|uniref:Uncharacterized protein n=1 Tax=Penicillium arizonense TaxID=1835702 RepID=A0A1F5KZH7_PENAI|nr:hypothetical protein PENARI_c343G08504 [Penicillium arizonense]XP_022481841.1 hypothetical protein PENARI_c342G02686 [Penicillium arizonense]OGE46315.1 hypothetical protein PENARI_c343G08504 [Penicillium arizonense]OGE46334.1 hypothetical protein PENARI_c342G02686 [Penicillium arizonense]
MDWMLPLLINSGTRRYAKQLGMDTNRLSSVSTGTLVQSVLVM